MVVVVGRAVVGTEVVGGVGSRLPRLLDGWEGRCGDDDYEQD